AAAQQAGPEDEPEGPAAPVIHVAERALGESMEEAGSAPAPAKKRTRRGSGGGKNRRKKPAGAATVLAEVETGPVTETEVVQEPEPEREPVAAGDPWPEASRTGNGEWGCRRMS